MPNSLLLNLRGIPVPKKNSRMCFVRGGRMFNIPSKRFKDWHSEAMAQLKNEPKMDFETFEIIITFHFPDKRRRDLTNLAESIMDLLVDACIITDDNWQIVPCLKIVSAGINKEYPHTEVSIYYKENL